MTAGELSALKTAAASALTQRDELTRGVKHLKRGLRLCAHGDSGGNVQHTLLRAGERLLNAACTGLALVSPYMQSDGSYVVPT